MKKNISNQAWAGLQILEINMLLTDQECLECFDKLKPFIEKKAKCNDSLLETIVRNHQEIFAYAFDELNMYPSTIARALDIEHDIAIASDPNYDYKERLALIAFRNLCFSEVIRFIDFISAPYLFLSGNIKGGEKIDEDKFKNHRDEWERWKKSPALYKNLSEFYIKMQEKTGATEKTIRNHLKIIKENNTEYLIDHKPKWSRMPITNLPRFNKSNRE